MLFFLEVNLETLVCLIIIEKQCSLVFKIMDSGASLPGSNSQILPWSLACFLKWRNGYFPYDGVVMII